MEKLKNGEKQRGNKRKIDMEINRIEELAFKTMGKRKSHSKREKWYIYYYGLRTAKLAIAIRKIVGEMIIQRIM